MASYDYDDDRKRGLMLCAFALLFSIPFHVLLISVLVRYRKSSEFSFPYFHMLLSLSINDVLTATFCALSFLIVSCSSPKTVVQYNSVISVSFFVFFTGGMGGDAVILVAIGINRLTAYLFPHKNIWHPVHTKFVIMLQWVYAILFGASSIHPDLHGYYYLNETTGLLVQMFPESMMYQIKAFYDVVVNMLAGMILAVVYAVCVGKLIHYKLTTNTGGQEASESLAVEARLSLQGFFLSSSLVTSTGLFLYAFVYAWVVSSAFFNFMTVVAVSNFVFGPFIVMAMSKQMRKQIKKFFKPNNNNVVHILPKTNAERNL